ncbi:MAG: molybdopterin cofactor-binding domain-containing protein [Ignavibacteria bacterium]
MKTVFKNSGLILEEVFQTQFVEHAYMEPEVAICNPRHDGVMEVYASMQHPFSTRRFVNAGARRKACRRGSYQYTDGRRVRRQG